MQNRYFGLVALVCDVIGAPLLVCVALLNVTDV